METKDKKILIVEDEEALRMALVDNFTAEGFTVLSAANGEEGLEKALKESPDLILLDIVMPKMDGIVMAQKLKAENGDNIPMIILSNFGDAEHVSRAVESNVFDYFLKSQWRIKDVIAVARKKLGLK